MLRPYDLSERRDLFRSPEVVGYEASAGSGELSLPTPTGKGKPTTAGTAPFKSKSDWMRALFSEGKTVVEWPGSLRSTTRSRTTLPSVLAM